MSVAEQSVLFLSHLAPVVAYVSMKCDYRQYRKALELHVVAGDGDHAGSRRARRLWRPRERA